MSYGPIYTVAGTGPCGFSGDGGPATAATLCVPEGVAVDSHGNVVIADWFNLRIRVVAGSTGTFYGQHMTGGDIYTVAGAGTPARPAAGAPARGVAGRAVHEAAGCTVATSDVFTGPQAVTVDHAGNLLVADPGGNKVWVVAERTGSFYGQQLTAGCVYTLAGTGILNFFGDGGPATSAWLSNPSGVAVSPSGVVGIADLGNERVRTVQP